MNGIPETDLIVLAEREVMKAARKWASLISADNNAEAIQDAEDDLLAATTLLTAREAMKETQHLEKP